MLSFAWGVDEKEGIWGAVLAIYWHPDGCETGYSWLRQCPKTGVGTRVHLINSKKSFAWCCLVSV